VHLTGNELTAASSAVAALAIIGGYLGVRSANRNALKIAREERSSRRQDELDALKRATYAKYLAAIAGLAAVSIEASTPPASSSPTAQQAHIITLRRRLEARMVTQNVMAEIAQIAPSRLYQLAQEALNGAFACTPLDRNAAFISSAANLQTAMFADMQGLDIPSPGGLDRMADNAMSKPPPGPKAEEPAKPSTEQE
jgi:hypothetical protein